MKAVEAGTRGRQSRLQIRVVVELGCGEKRQRSGVERRAGRTNHLRDLRRPDSLGVRANAHGVTQEARTPGQYAGAPKTLPAGVRADHGSDDPSAARPIHPYRPHLDSQDFPADT